MLLLAVPALGLRMHSGNIDTLPASITEVQTLRDLQKAFPVEGSSAQLREVLGLPPGPVAVDASGGGRHP